MKIHEDHKAHPNSPGPVPAVEEYEKKSQVFVETEGILGAKIAGGKNVKAKELLREMEGVKKLMKKDGDLQCGEDLAQVSCSLISLMSRPFRRYKVFQTLFQFCGFALLATVQAPLYSLHHGTGFPNQRMCSVMIATAPFDDKLSFAAVIIGVICIGIIGIFESELQIANAQESKWM